MRQFCLVVVVDVVVFVVVIVLDIVQVPFKVYLRLLEMEVEFWLVWCVVGWWVVVGGVGVQTHLHVKPNSVELERTLAMRCEVGCVLPQLFLSIWKTKSGKSPFLVASVAGIFN